MNEEYVPMGQVVLAKTSRERKVATAGISLGAIKNHEQSSFESANDFLNRYLASMVAEAQVLVTACQTTLASLNDEQSEFKNKCMVYPRLQIYNTAGKAFRIEWAKFIIFKKKGSQEIGKTSARIPAERLRYPATKFKDAPVWALNVILEYENRFVAVRQKYQIYKEIKRQIETLIRIHNAELKNNFENNLTNPPDIFNLRPLNIVD